MDIAAPIRLFACAVIALCSIADSVFAAEDDLKAVRAAFASVPTARAALDPEALDAFILSTMSERHVPGLSACLIKGDSIVWQSEYGWQDIGSQTAVNDTTLFMLASISKTLTVTALMQLWENRAFDLDDDINDYLPWTVAHPLFPDSVITVQMLLTHTSGLRFDNASELTSLIVFGGDSPLSLEEFLRGYLVPGGAYYDASGNWGDWPPGSRYEYGQISTTLAAFLVERLSGTPFAEYCRDSLFEPLGMDRISWFLRGLNTATIALPYCYLLGGYIPYGHYGFPMWPAGQARTSALDLAPHLMAYLGHGQYAGARILDSATVALTTSEQLPGMVEGQGLIWHDVVMEDRVAWGHAGSSPGVATGMYFSPSENTGVIVLTNGESTECWAEVMYQLFEFGEDVDGDGVIAGYDNCPERYNPDQLDSDSDGVGDICQPCCAGPSVGNLDGSPDSLVTVGDLTILLDHLFISLTPLQCFEAGNLDLSPDGLATMGDLTVLIDHLFISYGPLPPCPQGKPSPETRID